MRGMQDLGNLQGMPYQGYVGSGLDGSPKLPAKNLLIHFSLVSRVPNGLTC